MAASSSRKTNTRDDGSHPIEGFVQKAGTIIYKGCMAMHVAGVFQPAASAVAGAVYAGVAEDTYDVSAEGSDYTWPRPMVFKRMPAAFAGKSGDLPTAADLGTNIAVSDDQTVKATTVANDVELRLLSIEGAQYWVVPV